MKKKDYHTIIWLKHNHNTTKTNNSRIIDSLPQVFGEDVNLIFDFIIFTIIVPNKFWSLTHFSWTSVYTHILKLLTT